MAGFSRPGPLRPQSERNFFIVSGLPEDFNWQKLKDLIRENTTNQPGWTNIDESWHGPEGAKGYFSVKSMQDAENIYNQLVQVVHVRLGRPLLVHRFDALGPEPILIKCNCQSYYGSAMGHSDHRSRITARSVLVAQDSPNWQPMPVTIPMQHPGMTVPMSMPQMAPYVAPVPYYQPAPHMAMPMRPAPAMMNEHGLPVNSMNGVVRTESRGLHISNLARNVSEAELRELLLPYGRPLGVNLKQKSATVRFGSTEEVRRAIENLDKRMWKERELAVKEDRDSTAVSEPVMEPVIVRSAPQQKRA